MASALTVVYPLEGKASIECDLSIITIKKEKKVLSMA